MPSEAYTPHAMKEGGASRGTMTLSRPTGGGGGRIEGGRMPSVSRSATGSFVTPRGEGAQSAFVFGRDGAVRSVTAKDFKAFPKFSNTIVKQSFAESQTIKKETSPKFSLTKSEVVPRTMTHSMFEARFQPFPTPKTIQETGGTVNEKRIGEIRTQLRNMDRSSVKPGPISLEKKASLPVKQPEMRARDTAISRFAESTKHAPKELSLPIKQKEMITRKVSLKKIQQESDQKLVSSLKKRMLDAGFVKTPAEADKKIEQVWTEKYSREKIEILPREKQTIIQRTIEGTINRDVMQRQQEVMLKQQKMTEVNGLLSKMGIIFEAKDNKNSLIAQPMIQEINMPGLLEQKKRLPEEEEAELLMQYLAWKRKQKGKEKSKLVFVEDKHARIARENLTLKTVVSMFTGKIWEAPHMKEMVTGEQIAAALPASAPLDAKSQIVQGRVQDDGSYIEWIDRIKSMGELNSRSEAFDKITKAIDASRPVKATENENAPKVSGFEVWKVLFGKGQSDGTGDASFGLAA